VCFRINTGNFSIRVQGKLLGGGGGIERDKKVNCPLVQALRLCTDRAAIRGSGGIALLFHDQRR